jgi:hypothetical protein
MTGVANEAGSRGLSDSREPSLRHTHERLHPLDLGHQRAPALWRYPEPASVATVLIGLRRDVELADP